jgi:threonine/homoserine/homoserine lactone efflux protein
VAEVIGALLPLAIGVAISPIPIIAAILMLLSPRARSTGLGFLVGWSAGIVVSLVIFVVLASVAGLGSADDPSTATSWIKIALGVVLLLLAIKQWRSRPKTGETAALPGWMQAIDTVTTVKSVGLGFLLAALNPKNLAMCIAAGVVIGGAELDTDEILISSIVFIVIAASSVAVPVIAYLAASSRMQKPLSELRVWLVQNNATVMTVLLAVIGVTVIGQGVAGLG